MPQTFHKELTPVLYGDVPLKVLPRFRKAAGQRCFESHWHERMEVLRIVAGSLRLTIDGAPYTARQGDAVCIGPRLPHWGEAQEDVCYDALFIDLNELHSINRAYRQYVEPIADGRAGLLPILSDLRLTRTLEPLFDRSGEENPLSVLSAVYAFLGALYDARAVTPAQDGATSSLDRVLQYMQSHAAEPLSSGRLSAMFGYNAAYFSRRFHEYTGVTPTVYLRVLRLERARQMLEHSADPVGFIASRCGFRDAGYFIGCFRRHYGVSPSAYRKQCAHREPDAPGQTAGVDADRVSPASGRANPDE